MLFPWITNKQGQKCDFPVTTSDIQYICRVKVWLTLTYVACLTSDYAILVASQPDYAMV